MSRYDASEVIDQLLRQHEAGIKMYLVCRLGSAEQLQEAYSELRAALARGPAGELQNAPSLPAYAYATARRFSKRRPGRGGLDSVAWQPTPSHDAPEYSELLDRVRTELSPMASEALELHHARGLTVDDVAYVMGVTPNDVGVALTEGEELVRGLATSMESKPALETVCSDAFRPQTSVEAAGAEPVHSPAPRLMEGTLIGARFEIASAAQTLATQSIALASDTSVPGQSVVLHLLHRPAPTTAARNGLLRKLRLLDSVVHTSIGRTLGYGWHADRLWYATPWYEGHTLGQLVEQGPLSAREAIEIFVPLARGLAALHQSGVVHRDISPEKILLLQLGSEGTYETLAILSEFEAWLTGEMPIADEPRFLAPEVAQRLLQDGYVGAAASSEDVFALGLVLLSSLEPSARPPKGERWAAFLERRASEPIEVPSTRRTAPFAALLRRALAIEPGSRPSAAELASELDKLGPSALAEQSQRKMWIPVSIGALTLALLLVAVFVRQSRLKLIRETHNGAEVRTLSEELEAEKARSRHLESELNESSTR